MVHLVYTPRHQVCVGVFYLSDHPSAVPDDALQKKVHCTACGQQVNQFQRNSVIEHPVLKVLICKVRSFPHSCRPVMMST